MPTLRFGKPVEQFVIAALSRKQINFKFLGSEIRCETFALIANTIDESL